MGGRGRRERGVNPTAMLLALLATVAASEGPPPVEPPRRAEAAAPAGHVWIRPGPDLVVGSPDLPDRPALRPLADYAPVVLPEALGAWRELGADCAGPLSQVWGDQAVHVVARDPRLERHAVEFLHLGRLVALAELPPGVHPCEIVLDDLDGRPGQETALVWRSGTTTGVTVWAWPPPP